MRCPLPPGSRVWAYTRDSGGEDQSIGDQNRAVSGYCEENELVLEHLFCDEARPGSSVAGRERFEEMIHLARSLPKEHLPQGFVICRFSRFGRNYDDSQFFKADLRRRGFVLVAIADDIPSDNGYGRVIEAFTDWHNEQFLKELSKDVKRGLQDLAKRGYCPGGFPPAGYKVEKEQIGTRRNGQPRFASRWVIDPEKAPAVRRAWEMRAAGSSYAQIHEATHVHNAKGSYNSMFKCVTYLGILRCGDLEIEGAIEPLISQEIWDAVQKRFRKRPRKGSRVPNSPTRPWRERSSYLLSGMVRCAYCGGTVIGGTDNATTRPNPWPYYVCGQKKGLSYHACEGIKVGGCQVEDAVMEAVLSQILVPEFVMARVQGSTSS